MAKRRMGILIFLFLFCLYLLPCSAQAASTADAAAHISPDQACSLTVTYSCDGVNFSDLSVKLYKIAEVSADFQYTLTAPFADTGLILNGIQAVSEWNMIRSTLETHLLANGIEAHLTDVTNPDGQACFNGLQPGLYLAVTEPVIQADWTYTFDSALVSLPGLGTDGLWQYEVSVTSKAEALPPLGGDEVTEFKILKLWKGDTGQKKRPQNIKVEIFRNGISQQTVTLSEENHWSYSWSAKKDGADWTVAERNIPSGYRATTEERSSSFVLTNTWIPETPDTPSSPDNPSDPSSPKTPSTPKTGDTSNILLYIILLQVSGILLIIFGITGKRKRL